MPRTLLCLAAAAALGACSKAPPATPPAASPQQPAAATAPAAPAPNAAGPAVSGAFTANGKPAALTEVTAHKGDPFDGKPVTELVFSEKDQGGDAEASTDALFGKFGNAVVVRALPDGSVIGTDIIHSGMNQPGSVSISGPVTIKDYREAGGQISGHVTSGGPTDVFDQRVEIDLTFHAKAP